MQTKLGYAVLEVGGIQNFILGTGKLREMIGGSELIESLSKNFLENVCTDFHLQLIPALEARKPGHGEALTLQRNAGAVHLLFASIGDARSFVTAFCTKALDAYPALPLFAATEECEWDKDSLQNAKRIVGKKIDEKRASAPPAGGMGMLPLCQRAPLDGLPCVKTAMRNAEGKLEAISLPSLTRRTHALIEAARKRLRDRLNDEYRTRDEAGRLFVDADSDDLDRLVGGQGKIALIHMDGNDLGKIFRAKLSKLATEEQTPEASVCIMGELSQTVEEATSTAFTKALNDVVRFELRRPGVQPPIVMPVRPLVLGGDDVTAVVRADLSLLFIDSFCRELERVSTQRGQRLSAGVGMVVCSVGYPFTKAFSLAEALIDNAKSHTAHDAPEIRPSSLDYVILTNDVENDLSTMRRHIARTADGELSLTGKPYVLEKGFLPKFLNDALAVLNELPRSAVRPAMDECRRSEAAGKKAWRQMEKNLIRGIGGRANKRLMRLSRFHSLFPDGFFVTKEDVHQDRYRHERYTMLGDWLEIVHLLPSDSDEYLHALLDGSSEDA